MFDSRQYDVAALVTAPVGVGDTGDGEIARFGAAAGEDDAARRRSDECGDLVARLLDGTTRFARRAVAARWVADDAALPSLHRVSDLVAPRRRRGVVEVVEVAHAT